MSAADVFVSILVIASILLIYYFLIRRRELTFKVVTILPYQLYVNDVVVYTKTDADYQAVITSPSASRADVRFGNEVIKLDSISPLDDIKFVFSDITTELTAFVIEYMYDNTIYPIYGNNYRAKLFTVPPVPDEAFTLDLRNLTYVEMINTINKNMADMLAAWYTMNIFSDNVRMSIYESRANKDFTAISKSDLLNDSKYKRYLNLSVRLPPFNLF